MHHEPLGLDTRLAGLGLGDHGIDVRFSPGLRQSLKETGMLALTILVTVFLFGYLVAALLRPEWF